jgi:hypothetical protein
VEIKIHFEMPNDGSLPKGSRSTQSRRKHWSSDVLSDPLSKTGSSLRVAFSVLTSAAPIGAVPAWPGTGCFSLVPINRLEWAALTLVGCHEQVLRTIWIESMKKPVDACLCEGTMLSINWTISTFPRKSKHLINSDVRIMNFQKVNRR